jgi:hypothetical protein
VQGKLPTHPELLDWLARDFQRDWNVKRLVKQIVLSHTYRQVSRTTPEMRQRDPQNLYLSHAPSYRLSAEAIRDTALFASGLLDEKMGGPPVSPYSPGDLWRDVNSFSVPYQQSKGKDLYRRSLYTIWKRTAPMANMMALDATTREVCVARRPVTNTPLQAFVLLNDTQFVESARVLAERVYGEGNNDSTRLTLLYKRLTSETPTPSDLALLGKLLTTQRTHFLAHPDAAQKLLALGDTKASATIPPAELAALTVVAQATLNLDATLWKR